jgi:Flp pilus assembly protein TadD
LLTASAVVAVVPAAAQPSVADGAESAFRARDWARAAPAYEALARQDPGNPSSWFRLAVSLRELGRFEQ